MSGPPPTPTALKILRGNPGKRSLNAREPMPAETTADAPPGLPARARKIWDAHAAELVRLKILTAVDRDEFALFCRLRAYGLSQLRKRPNEALKALNQSSSIARRFGIGASDRARLTVGVPEKPKSKWAGVIGGSRA